MPDDINVIIFTSVLLLAAGILCGAFVFKIRKSIKLETFQEKAQKKIQHSEEEAEKLKAGSIQQIDELKSRNKEEEEKLKDQFQRLENLILSKEEQLNQKEEKVKELKNFHQQELELIKTLQNQTEQYRKNFILHLSEKTGQKISQIKEQFLQEFQHDLELQHSDRLRKYEEYLQEEKVRIAKNMVTGAIQRYSSPTSVEKKNTAIILSRDEIKGRILGKNAENILLLEELTGVDIIFNDAPNTINISCFDLVKKHIARETIQKLIKERIITPEKIRQKLQEAQNETEKILIGIGYETVKKLELESRNFPVDFYKIVGRLQFRTSYGQNILKHSFEVGNFTLMLGSELDLDMETCKIGGFFHDLGKAIDQEVGGSHDVLTKEIMEKYTFSEEEIHAAWTHHDAIPIRTAEAMLVKAGDAISAGRPGARQESIEKYIERIKAIEEISNSYEGVSKTFAISAGREVRVIVDPKILKDEDMPHLAKNIAEEIQDNVAYPGKIKVNIIRRTKSFDYAK